MGKKSRNKQCARGASAGGAAQDRRLPSGPPTSGRRSGGDSQGAKEVKDDCDQEKAREEEAEKEEQGLEANEEEQENALDTLEAEKLDLENRLLVLEQEASRLKRSLQAETAAHAKTREAVQQGRLAKLEDEARAIADLTTASLAQWFYEGTSRSGQARECEFSRIGNQCVEELYQGFLRTKTALVQLRLDGSTYDVDFEQMTQVNTNTWRQRRIRREVLGGAQSADLVEQVRHSLEARLQQLAVAREEAGVAREAAAVACEAAVVAREELQTANRKLGSWGMALTNAKAEEKAKGDAMLAQQTHNHALELAGLTDRCQDAESQLAEAHERLRAAQAELEEQKQNHAEARASIEWWRSNSPALRLVEEPAPLADEVRRIFAACSHQAYRFRRMPSRCYAFRGLCVAEVSSIHNPRLYDRYKKNLSDMSARHAKTGVVVQGISVLTSDELKSLFPGISLGSNEFLLAHGCNHEAAMSIADEGFDVRRARDGLYGNGVYFTAHLCKADQYAHADQVYALKHIIIARVALGDPAPLTERYTGKLAPQRPDGSYYDSAWASPDRIPDQHHSEFITFLSEQAYPELLVTYRCP